MAPRLFRTMVRGRWLIITMLVLVACAVMVRLAFWQLSRLDGRRAANAVIAARMHAPPVYLTGQTLNGVQPDSLIFRQVAARGTWDYANEVELRYRSFGGQPGGHVLTPLHLADGSGTVLVDRGWIPLVDLDGENRAIYQTDAGQAVAVEGLIYQSQPQTTAPAKTQGRQDFFMAVDIPAIAKQLPYPVLPVYIRRLPTGDNTTPPLAEGYPELDDGPHLDYAIQWFAFTAILLVTYVLFVNYTLLHSRRRPRSDTASPAAPFDSA
ncbi:MAG: SURF1 family protein [Thermomicrobiales bacterium]